MNTIRTQFLRRRTIVTVVMLSLATWQFGQAAYIHAKALLAQYLLRDAWQHTLNGQRQVKPWPWADTWPVARMRVPAHEIDLIVLAGDGGRTLAFGPGYRFGTAEIGAPGNTMISAHRDTHFEFLKDITAGESIYVQLKNGKSKHYRIVSTEIVDENTAVIRTNDQHSSLTLVTCYPFDAVVPGGPLRYIVVAEEQRPTGAIRF